ncbi:hypothetical protein L3Q82_009168, partial [Scortum barcoo]
MDEMKLRIVSAKIDSCVVIVTETWLDNNIPDEAVELAGALSSPGGQDCSLRETQRWRPRGRSFSGHFQPVPAAQGLPYQQASGDENGDNTSSTLVLSTGTPQGCVLSPALFTLFTSDCSAIHSTNTIVKVCRRHHHSGSSYRTMMRPTTEMEIQHFTQWCSNNNLVLNTSKTKEVIVDYRRSRRTEHAPLLIHGEAVERVNNIKFLGIHITSDLTWSMNTAAHLVKKAQQRLFFLRKLKRAGLSPQLLTNFYRATIKSILCLSATVCYGSCTAETARPKGLSPGGENGTGDYGKSFFQTWTQYTVMDKNIGTLQYFFQKIVAIANVL